MNTPQRAYSFMRKNFSTVEELKSFLVDLGIGVTNDISAKTVAAYIKQDDTMRDCIESATSERLKEIIYHLSLHNAFCIGLRKGMSL